VNRKTKPVQHQSFNSCTEFCGKHTLTIVFKTVPVCLRLERAKSDFASVAQDSALPMTDLDAVDLRNIP
jgi:hypothetical protein